MPCESMRRPNQTFTQRKEEIKSVIERLARLLASGQVKPVIDKRTGAIAFAGLSEADRSGVTDACAYRRIMATGSTSAKLAIQRAELLAGRSVDKMALAHGHHSHDGGVTWHHGH